MNEETESKIEKVKNHLKENKKTYITATCTFIAGAVGMAAYAAKSGKFGSKSLAVICEDSFAPVANGIIGNGNRLYQRISVYGNAIGRPGRRVYDPATDNVYESIGLAAHDYGVSYQMMWNHLHGKTDHIKGTKLFLLPE